MKKITTALALLLCIASTAHAKGVILNFSDIDISVLSKFMSDLTGKNILLDERVKGKVSIFSPTKLSNEEAFSTFCSMLEMKGFTVLATGKSYQIVPVAGAKQAAVSPGFGTEKAMKGDGFVAQVIPLEHVSPQEAVTFFQPLLSKEGHVSPVGQSNTFLVIDSAANVNKVLAFLKYLDVAREKDRPEMVPVKHANAETLVKTLREWLAAKGKGRAGAGDREAVGESVFADARTNGIVITSQGDLRLEIQHFISVLDVPAADVDGSVNVYYCEFADAVEVAKVVEAVVKGSAVAGGGTGGAQAPALESGKIVITPDKATNSLVIVASLSDLKTIMSVVRKLDRKRRQVFVQAVIAEVSLTKLNEMGVQLGVAGAADGKVAAAGVFDPFSMASGVTAPQRLLLQALQGMTGNVRMSAEAKALYSNGTINILSTPTIMTADNEAAEIFVGENVPFVTSSSLTSNGLSQQSVERRDTGITLKITPQINVGNSVRLHVYQEISAVKTKNAQAVDLITAKRSTKTVVEVPNRETVLIGGLIQDSVNEQESKVPVLGDIPVLGWIFKTRTVNHEKTNLMVMLTPRIVDGSEDVRDVTYSEHVKFGDSATLVGTAGSAVR